MFTKKKLKSKINLFTCKPNIKKKYITKAQFFILKHIVDHHYREFMSRKTTDKIFIQFYCPKNFLFECQKILKVTEFLLQLDSDKRNLNFKFPKKRVVYLFKSINTGNF